MNFSLNTTTSKHKTKQIIGFEALIRWKHPKLGIVSPAQFIPLAEETGFIIELGNWILRTACLEAKDGIIKVSLT